MKTKTAYRVRGAFSHVHADNSVTWFTRRNEAALADLSAAERDALLKAGAIEAYQQAVPDADASDAPLRTASEAPDSEAGQLDADVRERDHQNAASADGARSKGAAKTTKRGH